VLVGQWEDPTPCEVAHYRPAIPGRVPFVMIPEMYQDTWLDDGGPRWDPRTDPEPPQEWLRVAERWIERERAKQPRR
jgi:hypothetical protein